MIFLVRDWMSPTQYAYGRDGGCQYLERFLDVGSCVISMSNLVKQKPSEGKSSDTGGDTILLRRAVRLPVSAPRKMRHEGFCVQRWIRGFGRGLCPAAEGLCALATVERETNNKTFQWPCGDGR